MPSLSLPTELHKALEPLFEAIPLEQAMGELVPGFKASPHSSLAAQALASLQGRPDLEAGIWIYVDDLERAHRISQDDSSQTGSMWHAIIHRREGDFWNSGYWLRRAGKHPAFADLRDYDSGGFLADVEQRHAGNPADLVELQRQEWLALFKWCAERDARHG